MAIEIPRLDTSGKIVSAAHLYGPEDFVWISLYGETEEYFKRVLELPFVLSPIEVVASLNKTNEETLAEFTDAVENLFETHKPDWWEQYTLEEKRLYLEGMPRQIPRWKLQSEDTGMIVAIGTVAIYAFMVSPLWKPVFLEQPIPWEDYLEVIQS